MRASHRPGASTSAGVGSSRSLRHRRVTPCLPARSAMPFDEGEAAVVLLLGELEAEELLDEAVRRRGLDPAPAQRPR